MARATLWFILVLVVAPRCAAGFACNYPTQRLTGLADIGRRGSFVKLDLTVRLIGPECEVLIDGGLLRCSSVGSRTLGVRFASTARGTCPGWAGRITDGSYTPRSELAEPTLADVTLEARLVGRGLPRTAPVALRAHDLSDAIGITPRSGDGAAPPSAAAGIGVGPVTV